MKRLSILFITLAIVLSAGAQQKSTKRGVCWDEKTQKVSNTPIEKLLPGVSWLYNWGATPQGSATNVGSDNGVAFYPMAWNGGFDEAAIRNYFANHKSAKYLLGFNEPNFSAQSNMTPESAAIQWPRLESIANDYNVKLVAPALNFTGEKVGGKVWSPYEWLDEFIKQYKSKNNRFPKMDCLALHCYMNWFGANTWFATEYFYKDLYDKTNKEYGKYPNVVAYFDAFKAENGHFPKMMLTEFCSWENDGTITNVDFQIDQMTQKVQKLEQSDLVEGYAWFMANATASAYPYFSLYKTNSSTSELSDLGKVYVNMSSFDKTKYYAPDELIQAKDYIEATTDNAQVKLRPNTDSGSKLPLQAEMLRGTWMRYQIDVPTAGEYMITLRIKSTADNNMYFYVDGKKTVPPAVASTNGIWADRTFNVTLPAGKHEIMLYNSSDTSLLINSLKFTVTTGIDSVDAVPASGNVEVYNLSGMYMGSAANLSALNLEKGIYIVVTPSGEKKKTLIK